MGLIEYHFDIALQRQMIEMHGTMIEVFPVLTCPCRLESMAFNPLCESCHGTGNFYPPGTSYAMKVLPQGESSARQYEEPGSVMRGTIMITVPPESTLAERDKVRFPDMSFVYTDETLCRGVIDFVRFQAGVVLLLVADVSGHVYRQGLDYALGGNNTVLWLPGGQSPALEEQYAVRYKAYPEYLVFLDTPRGRTERRRGQSQEVVLRLYDHLTRE